MHGDLDHHSSKNRVYFLIIVQLQLSTFPPIGLPCPSPTSTFNPPPCFPCLWVFYICSLTHPIEASRFYSRIPVLFPWPNLPSTCCHLIHLWASPIRMQVLWEILLSAPSPVLMTMPTAWEAIDKCVENVRKVLTAVMLLLGINMYETEKHVHFFYY